MAEMGNSLLDIIVFGRNAGKQAAARSKDTKTGKLTLEHIDRFAAEMAAGNVKTDVVSPKLLPNYARKSTK